jgi:hypothetical protein
MRPRFELISSHFVHFGEKKTSEIEALTANIALVKNNASVGGKLAAKIAENERKKTKSRL